MICQFGQSPRFLSETRRVISVREDFLMKTGIKELKELILPELRRSGVKKI